MLRQQNQGRQSITKNSICDKDYAEPSGELLWRKSPQRPYFYGGPPSSVQKSLWKCQLLAVLCGPGRHTVCAQVFCSPSSFVIISSCAANAKETLKQAYGQVVAQTREIGQQSCFTSSRTVPKLSRNVKATFKGKKHNILSEKHFQSVSFSSPSAFSVVLSWLVAGLTAFICVGWGAVLLRVYWMKVGLV